MTATQEQQPTRFYAPRPWTLIRFLFLIAAVCFFIAALTATHTISWGPYLAWLAGGLTAFMLTGAA
jgi:hypothetical protein